MKLALVALLVPAAPVLAQRVEATSVRELSVQPVPDAWGRGLGSLGDLDGNGFDDVAIGAPWELTRGEVWIAFLGPGGQPLDWFTIERGVGAFAGPVDNYDWFGHAVAALGDLGGDGTLEIAVGTPGRDEPWGNEGIVWILSLDSSGTPVSAGQQIGNGLGGFTGFLAYGANFGEALASLGDLDGDGTVELAVGVPKDDTAGFDVGRVWILSLDSSGNVARQVRLSNGTAGFGRGLAPHDHFGSSLAALGDLNGDGTGDLAVGAAGNQGRVWLLFLNPDATVQSKLAVDRACLPGPALEVGFGASLANLGDPIGDGSVLLAVGTPDAGTTAEPSRGAVQLVLLGPGGAVTGRQLLEEPGGIGFPLAAGSRAGHAIAAVGDVNGDGRDELVVSDAAEEVHLVTLGADLGRYYCTPATPSSTGCVPFLWASGSTVLADQDFRLTATQLPATPNLGYFLMGTGQATFVPPGSQGALCVTPGMVRLFPTASTLELQGGFQRNVALTPAFVANVTPGSTWNFQAWFRDGANPSDFTDAVSVTFQ